MLQSDSLVPVGKIVSAHGIRGLLKVNPYGGDDSALLYAESVVVRSGTLDIEHRIARVSRYRNSLLLGFEGCDDISLVERFLKCELFLRRSQLPETGEDEYYWCDLIGLKVVTDTGRVLGNISDILETGSNDVYKVQGGGHEYLIPALADVVTHVDLKGGVMTIVPLEGLLDL